MLFFIIFAQIQQKPSMEQFSLQDTTRLLPPLQDTVRVQDSIPANIGRESLLDLDSVMNQIDRREEAIKVQQARPIIPVREPEPLQVFHYSPEGFWEGYTGGQVFSVFKKPGKLVNTSEIVSLPVLENDNLSSVRNDGKTYLHFLEKGAPSTPIKAPEVFPEWALYIVLFSFLALTLLKMAYTRFLEPIFNAVISHKETAHLYSNRNSITQNTFFVLHVLFALNTGLFVFLTLKYFNSLPDFTELSLVILFSAAVYFLYQFKYVNLYLLGFFFDQVKAFAEYIHSISIFNKFLGIILIPVMAGMLIMNEHFAIYFIYTGIGFISLLFIVRVIRGAGIILGKGFSVFYLFLYLCALEILPLLIVYKLLELKLV
jgi:hypothetical protein